MTWLYIGLGISIGIWIVLAIYVFPEIKKTYDRKGVFTNRLLYSWYAMWGLHHFPLALAALLGIWLMPVNEAAALAAGALIFIVGVILLPMGMVEFHSLRRSTGQDISKLITSGIYRWSRNPQFVGWFLMLLGISIAGRSGFALALTMVFAVILHLYTTRLAEPYLEHLYGEEYRRYMASAPRYIGMPE